MSRESGDGSSLARSLRSLTHSQTGCPHPLTHSHSLSIHPSVHSSVRPLTVPQSQQTNSLSTNYAHSQLSLTHTLSVVSHSALHSLNREREGREEGWILPFTPTPTHSLTHSPLVQIPPTYSCLWICINLPLRGRTVVYPYLGLPCSPTSWTSSVLHPSITSVHSFSLIHLQKPANSGPRQATSNHTVHVHGY